MIGNSEKTITLHADGKEVLLIGTAHVSRQSAELVAKTIQEYKPDTVCVELCQPRFQAIMNRNRWREMDILKVIREKKTFQVLANLLLAAFQKKIAEKLGTTPGQDMLNAITAAQQENAELNLADREIRITLARAWRSMGLWGKLKLMVHTIASILGADDITEEDVEKLKQEDMLQAVLAEFEASHPVLRKILIDERDQYLAHSIRNAPGQRIVAVVGAGHMAGICRYWDSSIDVESLKALPPRGIGHVMVKWSIPALIVAVFCLGFMMGGVDAGVHMIGLWILANSTLAGIGAMASFAHPITILSAAVAAPITSINPLVGAGWVAGIVETLLRRPTVGDLEDLANDITSVKGFWKNRVTRILLVVVFVNLGSAIGTFAALPLMANILHG